MNNVAMKAKAFQLLVIIMLCGVLNLLQPATVEAAEGDQLPEATRITGMPVFAQQHGLSCEYSATRAAVARWGIYISEAEFINSIGFDMNPHIAFRGNIDGYFGGTWDYGIYPEPIANYLAARGLNTKLLSRGVNELKAELARGRPVVVWIPAGAAWGNPFSTDKNGLRFKLMPLEHAITLYGYDQNGVYIADPGFGVYTYYSWATFLRSWSYLDNMAMSVWPADKGKEDNESIGVSPLFYRHWLNEGGVNVFGYPLTGELDENGLKVQYFERVRMEYDPNGGREQVIKLGSLGREVTATRLQETPFLPVTDEETGDAFYVKESKHTIHGAFINTWIKNDGTSKFGLPISEPFMEQGKLVQYFERSRFELTLTDNAPIIFGRLGYERLIQQNVSKYLRQVFDSSQIPAL